jgi:hypothetical protein
MVANLTEARALIEELKSNYAKGAPGNTAHSLATVSSRLGDKEQALTWLERAVQRKEPSLINADMFYLSKLLRDEPRFHAVLQKVGLKPRKAGE